MRIKYFGNSSFLFSTKTSKLITNPYDKNVKVKISKEGPDIMVLSHDSKDLGENEKIYLISSPGEYEVKDIFVYGYLSDVDKKSDIADIYMIEVEGVHIGVIDKNVKSIRRSVLDEIGIVNVLLVSLADDSGIKTSKMIDLVNKIDPQVVIPMDYSDENLGKFAKVLGVKDLETVPSIVLKGSDFSEEDVPIRVVVLKK